jgi:hypothetical protein
MAILSKTGRAPTLRKGSAYELSAETGITFIPEGMRFTMNLPLGPHVLDQAPA